MLVLGAALAWFLASAFEYRAREHAGVQTTFIAPVAHSPLKRF